MNDLIPMPTACNTRKPATVDARLAAAAPDLLAALQIVNDIWSHDQTGNLDPESPLAKVRAAIKKATGENK